MADSKSAVLTDVGVRVPLWAPSNLGEWKEALELEKALVAACGAKRGDWLYLEQLRQGHR